MLAFGQTFLFLAHKGGNAEEESGTFPENQAPHSQGGVDGHALLDLHLTGKKYKQDPDSLFDEGGKGGDGGFFPAVVIAVDTGVDGCQGDGTGQNPYERGTPWLQQNIFCNKLIKPE